ncbi:MAG: hypothetical protein Q8Q42_00590 [Nanoarchaeota archaeon]|nr:hypothetical protein [Nanoarchaeota archaeon]
MISPHKCPYCDFMFYNRSGTESDLQFEKYEHLKDHNQFTTQINTIIDKFTNIKKFVKIKYDAKFNKNRNTHQFIHILWNHIDNQYSDLLKEFDSLLNKYGIYFETIQKNIISNKTLSDFFAFYSELEIMEKLESTFNERPKIFKADNNMNTDFILHENKLIVEIKTPLETSKRLSDYVQDWEQQKQLKEMGEKYSDYYKILIVNIKYKYPDYPQTDQTTLNINGKKIVWDCCIVYNNISNKGDIFYNNKKNEKVMALKDKLVGQKQKSIISLGMENEPK